MSNDLRDFNRTLESYPETTIVKAITGNSFVLVELPTSEIFQEGDFTSRRMSDIKVSLITVALRIRGYYPEFVSVVS